MDVMQPVEHRELNLSFEGLIIMPQCGVLHGNPWE